jgi:hypothetical protein
MEKPSLGSILPEIVTVHAVVLYQPVEKDRFFIKISKGALKNTHFLPDVEDGTKPPVHQITIHGFPSDPVHHRIVGPLTISGGSVDVEEKLQIVIAGFLR